MGQEESTLVDNSGGPPLTLDDKTLPAVAEYIKSGKAKRIVVLTGAGISTAAGIPDFRSPKTGLYNHLARLNLPYAEAVFDISYFREHPEPFYVLAQELYPGKFHPTVSHAFIALLAQKGLLQMLFTQNIDCLERAAGVPADKIVEAHGSFATQRCIECHLEFPDDDMKEHVLKAQVPRCKDDKCNGLVKPNITFFGEALPREFSEKSHHTVMADLVLIIGTSLSVYPFASLPDMVRTATPRVLFNMESVGSLGSRTDDVQELGPCDDGIRNLADQLGWQDELERLWRGIVGDEEAERQQQRSQEQHEEEVEDEVQKLTEAVESALKLEEDKEESQSGSKLEENKEESRSVSEGQEVDTFKPAGQEPERQEPASQEPASQEPASQEPASNTDSVGTTSVEDEQPQPQHTEESPSDITEPPKSAPVLPAETEGRTEDEGKNESGGTDTGNSTTEETKERDSQTEQKNAPKPESA